MPQTYPRVPTQNAIQYTLDSQLVQGGTSLTLNTSVAGIVQAPGYFVIDRIDSGGNVSPSKREYIYFTGVSTTNITGLTRGGQGSTDQVHAVGAIVEFVPNVGDEADKYSVFIAEHTPTGLHASLPSLQSISVYGRINASGASLTGFGPLFTSPTITDLVVTNSINASGASLIGVIPIRPVWYLPGTVSAATVGIGIPLIMPEAGTFRNFAVVLRTAISAASLVIDINKNFVSIFSDQNTRPNILGGGTFVSGASIGTIAFNRGDIFTVDIDAGGWFADATVQLFAR